MAGPGFRLGLFGVKGLGFGVWGLGFRVWGLGLGFRASCSLGFGGLGVQSFGLEVPNLAPAVMSAAVWGRAGQEGQQSSPL